MITISGFTPSKENLAALNAVTSRLSKKDSSLWGATAQAEAAIRLNWIDLPAASRDLLPLLDALSAWSREMGHQNFVLCGMGGSSLAPEVIAAVYKKRLTVLDSTDPHHVSSVLSGDLSTTCFIVGSKSGSTIETASQKSAAEAALEKQGLDIRNHLVIITDPDSPLDRDARAAGLRVINADPNVGGRFSALSAFGLTPAALIGVDVSVLLDDALDAAQTFTEIDSAAVKVAASIVDPKMRYLGFCDRGSNVPGLSEWIEQLIAESTGKDGKGILPVVVEDPDDATYPVISFDEGSPLNVTGSLGGHFIFWEWVTALAGFLLGVDPFNQPNVTEAKEKTGALLERWRDSGFVAPEPAFESAHVQVFSNVQRLSLKDFLASSCEMHPGYLALMAYLHRGADDSISQLRLLMEKVAGVPCTFGWGPRFLHSTGQFHKGGPKVGSFIQVTGETKVAWPIKGKSYGFETLVMAQALGDNEALAARNYPVIRFHLKDREAGIRELLEAARSL
jgi:glucose-6-phosphate isomerase